MSKDENLNQSQRILNAAVKCVSSKGYANVSLRDIAEEADVVLSQLNYYYKNKEGLFIEVVKTLSHQYFCEIEKRLKKGDTSSEKMSSLIDYFSETQKSNSALFRLLFDLTSMSFWSVPLKELMNSLFSDIASLIEKYIPSDQLSNEKLHSYPAASISKMLLGTLLGITIQAMLSDDDESVKTALSALQNIF